MVIITTSSEVYQDTVRHRRRHAPGPMAVRDLTGARSAAGPLASSVYVYT